MRKGVQLLLHLISFCVGLKQSDAQEIDTTKYKIDIESISMLLSKEPKNVEYLRIRGWLYYSIGLFNEAIEDYDDAIYINSNDPDLYFRRGEIKFQLNDYSGAIEDYTTSIKISPDSLLYRLSRGVAYERVNQFVESLNDYNQILKFSPTHELTLSNRAILYTDHLKMYKEGICDWNRLIEMNAIPSYYNDRGVCYMELTQYDKAITDFNEAIELNDENAIYFFNRGYCYGMLNKMPEAFADFNKSKAIDSTNPFLYMYRGQVLLKKGDEESACQDFRTAAELGMNVSHLIMSCK